MFEKYFQKKINETYDLDGFANRFLRKISCVTDWCHRDHIGARYLSKKEEELKDEILIRGIKALSHIIHEVDEKVSIKVKEIQRDILAIFTDDGSESKDNVTIVEGQENIEENIKHIKGSIDKDKKPNHPGNIARSLLEQIYNRDADLFSFKIIGNIATDLRVDRSFINRFLNGFENVDYVFAYKLARLICGTDIRFWMDLQEKYDEYMEILDAINKRYDE